MSVHSQSLKAVPMQQVNFEEGFWADRQKINNDSTIPAINHQMDLSGRIDAWKLNKKPGDPVPRHYIFWDSDTGKWIEAAGYSLMLQPNPELEKQIDSVIELIKQAQQPDGYLNVYHTTVEPGNRWTNLRDRHELYNAGHLIEGAIVYAEATGKTDLLDVMRKFVDHIDAQFGPDEGQTHAYCGHPEIELALVRLYHATGEKRYFDLAKYFVDERGQQPLYFDIEARQRGDDPAKFWAQTYRYCQAHVPVREQHEVVGHSVRACYLYAGMADIAAETGDDSLTNVLKDLWDDLNSGKLYITAGIGPAHANEGFTFNYDLPNETAYAETCASISLAFWAHRMFHIDPDSRYIDVMERALYNGILSGVSFDGETFFYSNPLSSYPNVSPFEQWSGITSDRFYRRSEWFECPCCPPNLARIVASIGDYFYTTSSDTLYVHLYGENNAQITVGESKIGISQTTNYPWDEVITVGVNVENPTQFKLALRIPNWCSDASIQINGQSVDYSISRGYAVIEREWLGGDQVQLTLPMPVERMLAHPKVRQDAGQIALQRGPVVYCLEEADNGPDLANVILPREASLQTTVEPTLFGGIPAISADGLREAPSSWSDGLYLPESKISVNHTPVKIKAIPYFLWANRAPGEMRVWIREG